MANYVFYSWQSDLPNSTNRTVIEKCLKLAVTQLRSDADIYSSIREDLTVDSDIQNTTGNRPIFDTIKEKIDEAAAYVADVSFVSSLDKNSRTKGIPNPNVMIEYGYALKSLTCDKTILVMNTNYGEPPEIELPFNISHHCCPVKGEVGMA